MCSYPRRDDDVRAAGNLKCHLLPVEGNNGLVSTFSAVKYLRVTGLIARAA